MLDARPGMPRPSWDLFETYRLVRLVFGADQERLVRESARSVTDRQAFSSYHFSEAMRLSKAFERNHLADATTILDLHVQGAEKKERAFQRYIVKAGAHSLAAVQSLHAIPDIFAHAVYFAAGQNLRPHALSDSKISLQVVAKFLDSDSRFAALHAALRSIHSGAGWCHLSAAANMSKHRSIVRAAYSEDWTGSRANARELHVSAFERQGKHYPAVSLRELLEPEYERLMRTVISIGNELIACLRSASP